MSEQKFIRAKSVPSGLFDGQIYQYDSTGNKIEAVWVTSISYQSKSDAIDAAVEYAELHNIEIESIDFED